MALKIPEAFLRASATVVEARAKVTASAEKEVTARIDMSAEVAGAGLCPECRKPMEASTANGIPVLICREHRIAIPTADAPDAE
jgi:hypothetical protein